MGKADVAIAILIWSALGTAYGPEAWRRWREKPVEYPPGMNPDRYFDQNMAGVIFYTTTGDLRLDTNSCTLPNNSVIPLGK